MGWCDNLTVGVICMNKITAHEEIWTLEVIPDGTRTIEQNGLEKKKFYFRFIRFVQENGPKTYLFLSEAGSESLIWTIGGGSIGRRSRSLRPQTLARCGCWRMVKTYFDLDDKVR